ncbi:MAG: condensation domain-containing protein, partial [Gemmatimonadales bacterium]
MADPGGAPLSFGQEVLWFLDRASPGLAVYNAPRAVRLTGSLDAAALGRALTALVERQQAIRTAFVPGPGGAPVQEVRSARPVALRVLDLSALAVPEREPALAARIRDLALQPFDLGSGLLLRATLFRLSAEEQVLFLLSHHIVSDGWSRGIIFRELAALYTAEVAGTAADLPPLPIQAVDHARRERSRLAGAELTRLLDHWRAVLAGAPTALDLPTDFPRTGIPGFEGGVASLELSGELTASLHALARETSASLPTVLLAGLAAVLHRHTGQDDLTIGLPVAAREDPDIEGLVGFFANTLPIRIRLGGQPEFAELVTRTRDACLEAYEYADVPLEPLAQALHEDGRPSHAPLYQALFVHERDDGALAPMGPVRVTPVPLDVEAALADVTLIAREGATGVRLTLQYRRALFTAETAGRLLAHVVLVLCAAAERRRGPVGALPLVTAVEREALTAAEPWRVTA